MVDVWEDGEMNGVQINGFWWKDDYIAEFWSLLVLISTHPPKFRIFVGLVLVNLLLLQRDTMTKAIYRRKIFIGGVLIVSEGESRANMTASR